MMWRSTSVKRRPRLGLQPGDDAQRGAHLGLGQAAGLHQLAHIAPGQHFQRLRADLQRHLQHLVLRVLAVQVQQLQAQAFGQVAGAHAHGLQRLQQAQGHGEAVHQLVQLLQVVGAGQALGQLLQRVLEVAVVVEVFDQKAQRVAVDLGQAQRQRLLVQEIGQRLVRARQIQGRGGILVVIAVAARRGVAAPFAVVVRDVDAAVALPVAGHVAVGRRGFLVFLAFSAGCACAVCYGIWCFIRRGALVLGGLVRSLQAELLARGIVRGQLQKRVVVEHLLDFLGQLQGGQLQQPDGLLQLRRERQML